MLKHGRKEKIGKEEAHQYLESRRIRQDKLLEKWTKVDVGAGLADLFNSRPERARNTAQLVENQERYLKKMSEAIITQNFQTRPENVLKVVRIGSANSNRGDIFTEFPLTTVDDAIFFITMTYESTLRGATAGEKIYEKINKFYAGEMYETTSSSGAGTSHTVNCLNFPLVKGQVFVMLARELVGIDAGGIAGTGVITPVGTKLSSGTVDYTTGVVSLTFAASQNTADVVVMSQFDSENSTLYDQYGKVSLTVTKERFNARPQPLGYTYTSMFELMMGTEGLGDADDLLIGAVGDEHAKSRDYKAISLARSIALTNNAGVAYEFDTNFAAAGEVSDKMHAQKLLSKIGSIGGLIYDDVKRGMVNKAVAGSQALQYMKKHDLWKDDTSQVRTGVYKAGSLSDIDVYCCPAESAMVANDEILLTFKNPLEGLDIGIAFGVLTELIASLAYPQFYVDGNIATVEDYKPLTKDFIRLLKLTNLTF